MSFNLKSSISTSLILFFIITQTLLNLEAKEPSLAILKNIYSNETQKFQIKTNRFICKPYGIVSLESLYEKSKENSFCRKSIDSFYTKHRDLYYYSQAILKLNELYHIEVRDKECIIYAKGQTTLGELLLSKGVAINKSFFNDKEFKYRYLKVADSARKNRIGLWGANIEKYCSTAMKNN